MPRLIKLHFLVLLAAITSCQAPTDSTATATDSTAVDSDTTYAATYYAADSIGDGGGGDDYYEEFANTANFTFKRYPAPPDANMFAIVSTWKNNSNSPITIYDDDFRSIGSIDTSFVLPSSRIANLQMSEPDPCNSTGLWVEILYQGNHVQVMLHPLASNGGNSGLVMNMSQMNIPYGNEALHYKDHELSLGLGTTVLVPGDSGVCRPFREIFFYNDQKIYRIFATPGLIQDKPHFYTESNGLFIIYQDGYEPYATTDGQNITIRLFDQTITLTIVDDVITVFEDIAN